MFSPIDLTPLAHWIAFILELVAVIVILVGAIIATILFVRHVIRTGSVRGTFQPYRGNLGRSVLLGLEFLVAADIIGTVAVEPTFHNLGVLAVIVGIRTFLSFSLEAEIDGRWPWQARRYAAPSAPSPDDHGAT